MTRGSDLACHPDPASDRLSVVPRFKEDRMSKQRVMAMAMVASLMVVSAAVPASARGAKVTGGEVNTFAEGDALDYDVSGFALMARSHKKTIVVVVARGLEPGVKYGSHVHNQACADGNAGGHYSFGREVPGGALDGTEIWPGPFTARSNGFALGKTNVGAIAGPDAVSVVIHAPSGAKIACADLG